MTGAKLLPSFCVATSARKSTLTMRIYSLLDSSVEFIRKPRVKLKVMSNPDINFRNIRKHRSSQNDGFEELTRQLVLAEPPEGATEIQHRGPGADGGVEIIVRFADGRVWGWQSKYFTDGFGSSEVGQIKTSFSAALTNFPKLERYYVAIPRNLSGHAEGENDTQTKNWQNFKQWCEDEANALKRKVEIVLWDDTYFVSRLQRSDPAHAGMRLYWFDETVLDQDWFERQLSKSLAFIGKRYREPDHVDVKIGDTLEIMTKERGFLQRIDSVWSIIATSTEKLAAAIKTLDKTNNHIADFEQAVSLLGELSKAAEETDPTKLADQRIASLLKMLRDVENNGSVDFVLRQARFMTRKDPKKPDREPEPYVYPPKIRNLLAELQSDIMDASLEFSLEEIELFRTPALLVDGEAGIGKSHIIAREVQRHVQQGHPAVFIPGRTLDQGDKPESEILHYLDLKDLRFETFLGALDAAAKASGRPALIAIDGINESLDAAGWEPGLPKLISQVRQFDQIGFCASIRSAYKKLCIRTGLDVVTVQHLGFSANFGEVARQYLDRHGIERPSAPIFELRDILYNPLFLTTAVDFLLATKQTSFPRGLDSISKLIDFWLEAIEINLTTRRYDRIERGDGKILEVAEAIAAKMAEDGSEYLDFKTANVICEQIVDLGLPTKATDRLLMKLIDEGMFLDTPDYSGSKTGKHISFAFQKFSDYFIADAVLRHTGAAPALAAAIKPGGKYHYLFDEEMPWKFAGPRTALFALTALRLGKELPDLEADIGDHVFFSAEDFLDSLRWRQGNAIMEETRELLEDIRDRPATADEPKLFDDVYFDVLLRLKPRTFYDLVVQVAIVRPGPIQGDMVHPYLRRREGKEQVEYPTPELEAVLGKTLGVPLFQESAMRVAMVCAGFTGGEADQLRKSMATFKFTGGVSRFKDKLVSGMVRNGYTTEFAEKTFSQLEGFGSYGFPESHAASFALIAYASSFVKCHFPDAFCAALLNSQPMGFYAPAQIVGDARNHGVQVRPVCINLSRWDCTLERIGNTDRHAVRLGMRMVRGLAVADAAKIVAARMNSEFENVDDMWRRSGVPAASLVELAEADAFKPSLGLERRDALWAIKALRDEPLPLFAAAAEREEKAIAEQQEPDVDIRQMTEGHNVIEDYGHVGLTLRDHPIAFLRRDLARRNMVTCEEAMGARDGRWLWTAGLVLVRQKPGSAKGVMFITIEDETGPANIVVWPKVFERQRRVVLGSSMMGISGKIQREGDVIHLIAQQLFDLTSDLSGLADLDTEFKVPSGRGDEFAHGSPGGGDSRDRPKPAMRPRDIFVRDLHIDTLKVKARNFQ
ncbi:OB-fold nucleic acid binding domain-containing protein [Rhizobium sp. HT1-10]|uniref:helix-hairpin-helix domain-containing protein n=1 Tax=Rhizobium sp. HT1-10 TaxID=3111638 RepID=UPI003C23B063